MSLNGFGPLGDRLQQGEDLAAAVNAAASEQNYEAEWRLSAVFTLEQWTLVLYKEMLL